jgi:hypothetical protein
LGSELWELRVEGSAAGHDQEKAQLLTDSTRRPDITSRPQQMLSFRQVQLSIAKNLVNLKMTPLSFLAVLRNRDKHPGS